MFDELYEDNKKVIFFGGISLAVLVIILTVSSPFLVLEITYGIALLLIISIVLGGILLDYIITNWLTIKLLEMTYSDMLVKVFKIIGFIGTLLAAFSIIKDIINIDWQQWGIRALFHEMSSPLGFSPNSKTIFNSTVWPKYVQVLKALYENVGSIVISFIVNYVPPFTWIFATIGIFKNN